LGDTTRRYGLLLPHFGEFASRENLIKGAQLAEKLGFDSLWVRDHLVFHPHGMEGQDRTHVDPFVTLGLIAGCTEKLMLGTGSIIPYRHPIQAALALSSVEFVTGPGRVICGFGIGTFQHEFDAAGMGQVDRREAIAEQVEIMRKLWTGESVSFEGKFYKFDDIDIHPVPKNPRDIPIWYCGNTVASVRRAIEYCDGWMPGRISMKTFDKRVRQLHERSEAAGREMPTVAAIPITSPGRNREEARDKVNWREMMQQAIDSKWEMPDSGGWNSADDLYGALIYGTPDDVVEATERFHQGGLDHVIYDLRFRYDEWLECVQLMGEEVLPKCRRLDAGAR
jgi:probable F420-dependent oxidoreductase